MGAVSGRGAESDSGRSFDSGKLMPSSWLVFARRVLSALPVLAAATALHAQPVEIFVPQGETKGIRQATARFAQPMVALGDPRGADPFTVDCAEKGTGRWADSRNWVYDFGRDLPAGLRCSFTLKRGLTDVAGTALPAGQRFEFSTGGPAIVQSLPYEGSRIDENQVFILGLDAPVKPETVTANVHCIAAGVNEEIGVRLVTGAERRTILDHRKSFAASYLRLLFVDSGDGRSRGLLFRLPVTGSDAERFARLRDAPDSPLLTVACARTLPAGAEVKLVWGRGIAATTGVATAAAQALAFRVRPAFRATFSCERVNKDAQCIPILPLTLSFTAPIARVQAAKVRLVDAAGKVYPARLPQPADANGVDSLSFGPGLPEKQRFRIDIPEPLTDDAGRPLANARSFPLQIRTDENPPLAKFAADFGILERVLPGGEKPLLPVTVRNVERVLPGQLASVADSGAKPKAVATGEAPIPGQVLRVARGEEMQIVGWLRRLAVANRIEREYDDRTQQWSVKRNGYASSVFRSGDLRRKIAVPKPLGARAFEVVGIPLPEAGFHVVELASPKLGAALLGEPRPFYVRAAALVTNLGVHFKLGRESSLVWVTRLNDATPVPDAAIAVRDCNGRTYWEGRSDAAGIARVDRELPDRDTLPSCGVEESQKEFFVTARSGDDMAYAFSNWGEGISPWRFNVPTGSWQGPWLAHAVLDRSLLRAGETVSMKLFVRQTTGGGFALPPRTALGDTLLIRHLGSDREYTVPVRWNGASNAASGDAAFEIPKDAYAGTYQISVRDTLASHGSDAQERQAGSFRVEAFRVPLLRARMQAVGVPLVNPASVNLDLQVSYLAGGGAAGLPATLRTQVERRSVSFTDYDDFIFAGGDVREGRDEQGDATARFDNFVFADPDIDEGDTAAPRPQRGSVLPLTLDAAGGARATIGDLEASAQARTLVAELEYRDPNGETLTSATRVALWPAWIVLGIKPDSWVGSRDRLRFSVVALDLAGRPVAGVKLRTDAFRRETYSHRRRLIGGFYAYEHGSDTTRAGELCSGSTDALGLLICEVPAPAAGNLILRARAEDADGRSAVTHAETWVTTEDDAWLAASDNDRVDLLPEKKRYEPGQVARLQLRTPFRESTVLVTVEREGVLDAFVTTVRRGEPVLEVPIKGAYAPNVFVSAFLVRGRVGDVAPTAMIDLGRPSFKMGLAEVRVGWAAHELAVKVSPAREVYKVRDRASAAIAVRQPDGSAPPKGSEIALAVVDEGLLELLPNTSWKLLDAMMARRGDEVETATAQMQVIGKRHFGRKAVAPGGGGGRAASRELFDTLLMWRARVPLDEAGNATVEIPLNDSLTGFRIVAVASSGVGLFGTGEASIRSTQDLMLLSGLPPVVREGDRFRATFTVRNAGQRPLEVALVARTSADAAGAAAVALEPRGVALAPGAAQEVSWETSVPANADALAWQVDATEHTSEGARVRDALKVVQRVLPAVPDRTYQETILQLREPQELAVARPEGAIAGRGGLGVQVQAKLAAELPGVRDYFEHYPFSCFEQRASVAIGLRDPARWSALMRALPEHLDRDGMVKFWPPLREGEDALSAYLLSVAAEAGLAIPERERDRIEKALIGFVEGRIVRASALPTADLSIRKIAALEALSRRAEPLQPKWLDSIAIEPDLWPTSAVIDWYLILKRQPKLPRRDERIGAAEQILRTRLDFQGTTMRFSTEKSDALWWLMVSADANANKLLLAMNDVPAWQRDMPLLARGALGRMQHGRWNTTVANAWGTLALAKFSARFETTPVTGTTVATLAGDSFVHAWKGDEGARSFAKRLAWPEGREDVVVKHEGRGTPWVTLSSVAAVPLTQPVSSGYRVTRTVTPVRQQSNDHWRRGDVARVRLEVEAQSDMAWVVVDDPLPAGSTALGRGLGGESTLVTQGERRQGTVWPAFEERTATAFRAYYRYVPKGRFVVEYTLRLDNPGTFNMPATRVESMYAPEMFGELPNAVWTVSP
ncbi:MAG: alpha-2-macroglobulin [Burkholderiales bacterium]|nr:alpha-2-macroglobulin [Burkholderiales bacterium]